MLEQTIMSSPRNQHWIPQFYLRGFAVPGYRNPKNAKIWIMDTATAEVRKEKIKSVCSAEHLYSHITTDGTHNYDVEKQLAELESTIAQLYARVRDGYPDLKAAWGIKKFLSVFIASLMLRHPDEERRTRENHRRIVELIENAPKDEKGIPEIDQIHISGKAFPFDPESYPEYKMADENLLKGVFAGQIAPVAVNLSEHLFNKRWCFLCAASPVFLTSDSPVVRVHAEKTKFGLRTPGVQIYFPISSQRMLWMNDRKEGEVDGFYPFPDSEALELNALIFCHASRAVLGHEHIDCWLRGISALADEFLAST